MDIKNSAVYAYLVRESVLTSVALRADGACVMRASGAVVEDFDADSATFVTYNAVRRAAMTVDVRYSPNSVAMVGPSGAPTHIARALATSPIGKAYSLTEIIAKVAGYAKVNAELESKVRAFYADEAEIAA